MLVKVCADKTQITNIIDITPISPMLSTTPTVTITVSDFEGALYNTYADAAHTVYWKDARLQTIYILNDAADTYLFVGRIIDLVFGKSSLLITCEGMSGKGKDKPFTKNYIYASGKVKNTSEGADDDCLDLETDEDTPVSFTWETDQYANEVNRGILLTDATTGTNTDEWIASAYSESKTNCSTDYGGTTYADSDAIDADSHKIEVTTLASGEQDFSLTGTYTMSHNNISDGYAITMVNFNTKFYFGRGTYHDLVTVYWEAYKNGAWVEINRAVMQWPPYSSDVIPVELSETYVGSDLAEFFTLAGGNYTDIQFRFRLVGHQDAAAGTTYTSYIYLDYMHITIWYESAAFSPIQVPITANGASTVTSNGADFPGAGVVAGDKFSIGENTRTILAEALAAAGIQYAIDDNFDKYMARNIVGISALSLVQQICDLEDAYWFESYSAAGVMTLVILKSSTFASSGHSLTDADFDPDYAIERPANQYKSVKVYGNPYYSISAQAKDTSASNTSPLEFTIIDQSINTNDDAQAYANAVLNRLKSVRPSVILNLKGDFSDLTIGTTITVTFTTPSLTFTDYPIRRIDFTQTYPIGEFKAKIYIGLGQSPIDEKLARKIKKGIELGWKSQLDQLTNSVLTGVPIISHANLLNLGNDDHTQYHNNTRGDARYLQLAAKAADSDKLDGSHASAFEPADADIQQHLTDDVIKTAAQAQSACIETASITEDLTTKSPSSQLVFDALALKVTKATPTGMPVKVDFGMLALQNGSSISSGDALPVIYLNTTHIVAFALTVPAFIDVTAVSYIKIRFSWQADHAGGTHNQDIHISWRKAGENMVSGIDLDTTITVPAGNQYIGVDGSVTINANSLEVGDTLGFTLYGGNHNLFIHGAWLQQN